MSAKKFDPFVSEWVSFVKNPNHNLIEKCLKLAQILEYPELDVSKYIQKIHELGNSLKLKISAGKNKQAAKKALEGRKNKPNWKANQPF